MTYTKRQFFIYRIEQSINLLIKVLKYLSDTQEYTKRTKSDKEINKIYNHIRKGTVKLEAFLKKVKT